MRYLLIIVLLSSSLLAIDSKLTNKEQKALLKAIEDEKKFADEQRFYHADEYDFNSSKVDEKSVESLGEDSLGKDIDEANEGFDMDDVY